MSDIFTCFSTTNTEREAKKLAKGLVEDKLAAGVNIIPKIRSIYEWDGGIHDETEYLLIIMTTGDKLDLVRSFIDQTHSYEVPEFIALNVAAGLPDYMQWVRDMTNG